MIICRLLEESDISNLNTFYNRIHKINRTDEMFKWEFFYGPAGKAIYIIAVDQEKDKIVGSQCAIPLFLTNSSREKILSAKSEDTLVDPEYRGKNIFENMYQMLFEECRKAGIHYIWGFTSAMKPFTKLGFDLPYSHHQSLYVRKINVAYQYLKSLNPKNSLKDKCKIWGLCLIAKSLRISSIFLSTSTARKLKFSIETKPNIKPLNELTENVFCNSKEMVYLDQDSSYINWRINQNPYHNKVVSITYRKSDKVIANIIFNEHTPSVWYLIQDMYDSTDIKLRAALLKHALFALKTTEKVSLIRTWEFDHNFFNSMDIRDRRKAGFYPLRRGIFFVWKELDKAFQVESKNFYLSRFASQGVI